MVLVVSLNPQTVEACLKSVGREADRGGKEKKFKNIFDQRLGLDCLPPDYSLHGLCCPPLENFEDARKEYQLVRLPPYYKVKWKLPGPRPQGPPSIMRLIWGYIKVCSVDLNELCSANIRNLFGSNYFQILTGWIRLPHCSRVILVYHVVTAS